MRTGCKPVECHISAVSGLERRVTPDFDLSLSFFPVNFLWMLVCFGGFCEHFPLLCQIDMITGLF
jgi:hypothetical protein